MTCQQAYRGGFRSGGESPRRTSPAGRVSLTSICIRGAAESPHPELFEYDYTLTTFTSEPGSLLLSENVNLKAAFVKHESAVERSVSFLFQVNKSSTPSSAYMSTLEASGGLRSLRPDDPFLTEVRLYRKHMSSVC